MDSCVMRLEGISKKYGKKQALCPVSYELNNGVYGLLGPNGSGKSTMMGILTDSIRPDTGRVLFQGEEIHAMGRRFRRSLGYAIQQQGLYEQFTGRQFLQYMGTLKEIRGAVLREEVCRAAGLVHLEQELDERVSHYSGGMKQRLLLAQALMGTPKVVVLDEPTVGLDPKERVQIRNIAKQLGQQAIVLISTHVVSDIETIAKEILILKEGNVIQTGTLPDLLSRYEQAASLEDIYFRIFGEEG